MFKQKTVMLLVLVFGWMGIHPSDAPISTSMGYGQAKNTIFEHRIGTRQFNGEGEFFDRQTGDRFVPRGNNLIRLADQTDCHSPGTIYHSTFDVGRYDRENIARTLSEMAGDGYNVVRVFINHLCVVDQEGNLSLGYLQNFTDFLNLAKANGLFVMMVIDDPPIPGYGERVPFHPQIDWPHSKQLTQGGIEVEGRFWQDVILKLSELGAPLDVVFAYGLRNELFFFETAKPFSLNSGFVTTGNGRTYDVSDAGQKQRLMDENIVYWIDQIRAAILEVDPTALVTVGFFSPKQPNPTRVGDPRIIRTRSAIWDSTADFIDLHPYPSSGLTLPQLVENFEMEGFKDKPILMGEFGAFKFEYATAERAALALAQWQAESCVLGFDGWLLWTWDSKEQAEIWNALEDGAPINRALAPIHQPDPCASAPNPNVALNKPMNASRALASNPPSMAVDGVLESWWSAGDFAPQWIEIDLKTQAEVVKLRLTPSQSPTGETIHRVWGKPSPQEPLRLLYTFEGLTRDNQEITITPQSPWEAIRFIRIETVESPSWIAWREIEVIAAESEVVGPAGDSDADGDGVPDDQDYCPNFPGKPEANGC